MRPVVRPATRTAEPTPGSTAALRESREPAPTVAVRSTLASSPEAAPEGIELAIAGGAAMSEPTGPVAAGSIDGGWRFGQHLSARLQLAIEAPSVQKPTGQPIQLQRSGMTAGLAYRAESARAWIRPAILAGASMWRVQAQNLNEGARFSVQPTVGASAALGWRLTEATSLRLELGATLFLTADRYVVAPGDPVAESPRFLLGTNLGIEWASFH